MAGLYSSPNALAGRIVISYRRSDAAGHAGRLDDDLSDHFGEDQVYRDVEQLYGGVEFLGELERTIRAAAAVIVVIGPGWAATDRLRDADDVVRFEVVLALRSGRPVFPVLVGGAAMPSADELPSDVAPLVGWQFTPLTESRYRADLQQLVRGLERYLVPARAERLPALGSRAEEQDSWFAPATGPEVVRSVTESLQANGWRLGPWESGRSELHGGSRTATRLLGGMWVADRRLPSAGRIAVCDGPKTRVDVVLAEDLGKVLFVQMENRYRVWFRRCLDDLRAATGGEVAT